MNWIDYKKLLNEEFKIAVELDDYRDKWMRGYDDFGCMITMIKGWGLTATILILRSAVGVSQQSLNALNPALQYLNKKRYTPLRVIEFIEFKLLNSTNSYHEEACISEDFYLKGKTLKAETLKTNSTGEVGQ